MIPILILAGGTSSRMAGRDKLLEPVGGVPLLRVMADRAVATGHPVFVALPADAPDRVAALAGAGVTILRLPEAAEGMSGTLRAGVAALPACRAFLVLLADLPDLTTADLRAVIAAWETDPARPVWRGATPDGRAGHPILFDAGLRPRFADLSGDAGGAAIAGPLADRTGLVRFADNRARRDLDTPADWRAWRDETGL